MQGYFPVRNSWGKNWDSMENIIDKELSVFIFQKYGGLNILNNPSLRRGYLI